MMPGRTTCPPLVARRIDRVRVTAVAAGLGVLAIDRTWPGVVAAGGVAAAIDVSMRVRGSRAGRRRVRAAVDLPFAADLVAATLRAGATPDRAAAVVGEVLGEPVGPLLAAVAHRLRCGEPPARAWAVLSEVPGGERFAMTATRGVDSGAALASGLARLADDLRAARVASVEAAAHRMGTLVVLPLGLCFLPAFLLCGVMPVVLAVLTGVLLVGA